MTGIFVNPANPNRALVSYGGFNATTPTTPGHIFLVNYNPGAGTATWTSLDGSLGDLPLTDVVRDVKSDTIYVSSDFGVLNRQGGSWTVAAAGMPNLEVAASGEGGIDSGSPLGQMGSSRELAVGALVEPALLLSLAALAVAAGSTRLGEIVAVGASDGLSFIDLQWGLALTALTIVTLAETGRIPVDNPRGDADRILRPQPRRAPPRHDDETGDPRLIARKPLLPVRP